MKIRNFLAAAALLLMGAAALAQSTLQPYINGSDTAHRLQMFEVGMLRLNPLNVTLTAHAGGGQTSALPLTMGLNLFTTVANAGDSAILQTTDGGPVVVVINGTSTSMNIYPPVGGQINALGTNAAYALAAGKTAIFFQTTAGQWFANLSA